MLKSEKGQLKTSQQSGELIIKQASRAFSARPLTGRWRTRSDAQSTAVRSVPQPEGLRLVRAERQL